MRPSSLQLLTAASPRDRPGRPRHTSQPSRLETETGPHRTRMETETGPRHTRVETGVAKMNSVEVLDQASLSVTMATNRRAVLRMANGCTAGVPTVVTNRLMVGGGITNPAGPKEEEEEACSSSAGVASQSTVALNFLWSPDDRQPLLHREVPPAGALLSAPNTNNNNSNHQSCRCSSEGGPGLRPALDPDPAYVPASQARPVHSQQGTCTKTPQSSNQHLEHTEVTSEGLNLTAASSDPALSRSAAPVPDSDRDLPLSSAPALVQDPQTLAQRFADAADGHWCRDTDRSRYVSLGLRSAPDGDHRLPRPCSLDLSSSSALDGIDQSDSGLSVAGEKIRRRVKTPYTVKKWRPASWAPPSDQHPDLQLLTSAFPTMVQSRSSTAALVQRDTSKPDGITSF
ncbi:unnamed protein product [Knipowitschia caucasica]|uniref:Uncharacterized protein n=1 Tax=Knipowitschia caucasica TaxID=637954 RepID=A0AAV2K2D4_KNICA